MRRTYSVHYRNRTVCGSWNYGGDRRRAMAALISHVRKGFEARMVCVEEMLDDCGDPCGFMYQECVEGAAYVAMIDAVEGAATASDEPIIRQIEERHENGGLSADG